MPRHIHTVFFFSTDELYYPPNGGYVRVVGANQFIAGAWDGDDCYGNCEVFNVLGKSKIKK